MGNCKGCTSAKPVSNTPKKAKAPAIHIQCFGQITTLIIIIKDQQQLEIKTKGVYITDSNNTYLKGIATGLTQVSGEYYTTFTKQQSSKLAKELDIFMKEQIFYKGSARKGAHFLKVENYIELTGSGKIMASAIQILANTQLSIQKIYFEIQSRKLIDPLKASFIQLVDSTFFNQAKMLFLNSESEVLQLQDLFPPNKFPNFTQLQFVSLENQSFNLDSFLFLCKSKIYFPNLQCIQLTEITNKIYQQFQDYIEINYEMELYLPIGFKILINNSETLINFIKLINNKIFSTVKVAIIEIEDKIESQDFVENLISSSFFNIDVLQINCNFDKMQMKNFFTSQKNATIRELIFNEIKPQIALDFLQNKTYQLPQLCKFKFNFPSLMNFQETEPKLIKMLETEKAKNLFLFDVNNKKIFTCKNQIQSLFSEINTENNQDQTIQEGQALCLENYQFMTFNILKQIQNFNKLNVLTFQLEIYAKIANNLIIIFPNQEKINEGIKNIKNSCPYLRKLKFNYSTQDELNSLVSQFGNKLAYNVKNLEEDENFNELNQYCYIQLFSKQLKVSELEIISTFYEQQSDDYEQGKLIKKACQILIDKIGH